MLDETPSQHVRNSQLDKISSLIMSLGLNRKHSILLVGGLVVIIGGALFMTKSQAVANLNQTQESLDRALTVTTIRVKAENSYLVKQKYSGTVVAGRESDHGFDKGGLLGEVLVDEGARVKRGDVLARLDMRRIEARSHELEADLAQAIALDHETSARLEKAQASYDRYMVLRDKQHISAQKFEQVKYDLAALKAHKVATEAAVQRARAAVKSLEVDREMASLTARFDGSVVRRYQDEGAALGVGAPVVRLIEDQRLEIHVGLPQTAVLSQKPGDDVYFEYQGRKVATELRSVLTQLDQATRTVTAIFDVKPESRDMRAGSLAQLSVDMAIPQAGFWLPSSALAESRRGLWSVYTLQDKDGSANSGILHRQELQILHTESDKVFARGTLQDGDRVVTSGTHRLVPGQLVRVSEVN